MALGRYARRYSRQYYAAPRNYLKGYRGDSEGHRLAALGAGVPWARKYQKTYQRPAAGLSYEAQQSLMMPLLAAPPTREALPAPEQPPQIEYEEEKQELQEDTDRPGAEKEWMKFSRLRRKRPEPTATPGTPPGPATGFDLLS